MNGRSLEPRSIPEDRRSANLRDRWCSTLAHGEGQFSAEDIEYLLHAFLPERREAVDVRPADAYGARAESQGLVYVGAAAEAAVDENGELRTDSVHHFGKNIEGAPA